MSTPSTNFLSRGYAAIITLLEQWAPLTAVVRIGNIQAANAPGFRPRTNVGAGDRVELKLLEADFDFDIRADSLNIEAECLYPLIISSGSMDIDRANLVAILAAQAYCSAGPLLGMSDIVYNSRWVKARMMPNDVTAGRPDWTVSGGIRVTFVANRNQFLAARFT